mgnify:CR=1 FL=1
MKKHFWKLEYSVTIFVILIIFLMIVPVEIENYWQAQMITKWNDKFEKVSYMFSVLNAQKDDEIIKSLAMEQEPHKREVLLMQLIKPYLRLKSAEKLTRRYRPKYMDGSKVSKDDSYYFSDLYFSQNTQLVGIKDIVNNDEHSAWFMMMFDLNGVMPPNVWGKDIFGVYIYDEGKVVPFGYDVSMDNLNSNCLLTGLDCSYYYHIGGFLAK